MRNLSTNEITKNTKKIHGFSKNPFDTLKKISKLFSFHWILLDFFFIFITNRKYLAISHDCNNQFFKPISRLFQESVCFTITEFWIHHFNHMQSFIEFVTQFFSPLFSKLSSLRLQRQFHLKLFILIAYLIGKLEDSVWKGFSPAVLSFFFPSSIWGLFDATSIIIILICFLLLTASKKIKISISIIICNHNLSLTIQLLFSQQTSKFHFRRKCRRMPKEFSFHLSKVRDKRHFNEFSSSRKKKKWEKIYYGVGGCGLIKIKND